MPVLSKTEEGEIMQPTEYYTYFEDCILSPDIKECEAFALPKGIGQIRAFIDTLRAGNELPKPNSVRARGGAT